jgi:hypothetical protein
LSFPELSATDLAQTLCYTIGETLKGICTTDSLTSAEPLDKYPGAFIVQVDAQQEKEEKKHHWVLAYFESREKGQFFCSLGNEPGYYRGLQEFLKMHCDSVQHNGSRLQSDTSNQCGAYVASVLFYLSCGFEFQTILNMFHATDFTFNDNLAFTLYKHIRDIAAPRHKAMMIDFFHRGGDIPCTVENKCAYCTCVEETFPLTLKKGF